MLIDRIWLSKAGRRDKDIAPYLSRRHGFKRSRLSDMPGPNLLRVNPKLLFIALIAFITAALSASDPQRGARAAVERLALLAAGAALRASTPLVAEHFARTRFGSLRGTTFGTIDMPALGAAALLERALPR